MNPIISYAPFLDMHFQDIHQRGINVMLRRFVVGIILLLAGALLVTYKQKIAWHSFYCSTVLPLSRWTPICAGLFKCSNIVQKIDSLYRKNIVVEEQQDYPGYNTLRPLDESQPAVLRIVVKRERSSVILLPRLNGPDCRIQVYEIRDELKRKLFELNGNNLGWSPVGQRYELNIGCVDNGDSDNVFDVSLEIVMTGKWMQLWALGEDVFF
jgi:hypothetical protein